MPAVELHRDVPGYAEAARREEELRSVVFLGMDERIAGLPAAPLTLRKVQWLTMTCSPFLLRMDAAALLTKPDLAADIILFLWIVSPQFKAGDEKAKQKFYRATRPVMEMEAVKVIQEILDYIDEAFLDSGEGDGDGDQRSYYATAAAIVGFFHRSYHLQIDVWENGFWRNLVRRLTGQPNILDIPLKIAFQLIRVQQKSVNPEQKFTNRLSQPKIDAWLADLNQSRKN
jgi:hypothetical protein